jgi:hypothetical protein
MVPHASFHPYARPSGSRSPTPPPPVENLTSRPRTRSITSSEASPLRAPSPRRLFRSSATPPPQSLKRAPSFGATSVQTRAQRVHSSVPPESGSYSSDEEEKARQASAKRPRTVARRVPSFLGAPLPPLAPSPEEEILDPLVIVPEDPIFAPTIIMPKRMSLPPPPRNTARAISKPVASNPVVASPTPATPSPATNATPRTLRRIGTRSFPAPPSAATSVRASSPVTPVIVDAPEQPRNSSGSRHPTTQTRKSGTSSASPNAYVIPSNLDEERRRERRARRESEKEKDMEQAAGSSRRVKKKTASSNMKEVKPSVAGMRL